MLTIGESTGSKFYMKKVLLGLLLSGLALIKPASGYAQAVTDTLAQASLNDCIQYALRHQPVIKQSQIDQAIAERTIRSQLSAWYPQLGLNYTIQHYLKLPVQLLPATLIDPSRPITDRIAIPTGVANTSTAQFALTQNIFSRDVLLASRTATFYRTQARQNTVVNQIDVTVNVSKAFYDLLLSQRQAEITNEDIVRLERSLRDATNQYQGGLVDKTDAKRATISLNNARAQFKQYRSQADAKFQTLKQLMGYPPTSPLTVAYDTLQLINDVVLDTTLLVNAQNRIEYQSLQTQRRLLETNVLYNRWSYYPTIGLFGYYNFLYQNAQLSRLYSQLYPNSYVGLSVNLPIFQGGRRVQQLKIAQLQVERLRWDVTSLVNTVDAEYAQALANYKGNLANYLALRENVELAQDVYRIINLQYRSGIRTYLDVTVAEADLRTARLSYFNALFQVLSSKVDVQRALGDFRFQ